VDLTDRYQLDLVVFHWLTVVGMLDKATPHDRLRISEASLIDALFSFFSYGLLRSPNQRVQQALAPRASFGIRSNLAHSQPDSSATVSLPSSSLLRPAMLL